MSIIGYLVKYNIYQLQVRAPQYEEKYFVYKERKMSTVQAKCIILLLLFHSYSAVAGVFFF